MLLAALGGALEALAFPLVIQQFSLRQIDPAGHLEWIAWVGLAPALVALDLAVGGAEAFLLGIIAGMACFYLSIHWVGHAMTAFGGLPLWLALVALTLLVLYMAVHWGLAFWASFTVRRRLGWPLWVHLPVFWAATEFLRNHLFTGFPWANLGYTQVRHPAVAQLASLAGVYGIAALVVLSNAVIAEWWRAWRSGAAAPWKATAVAGALVASTVVYGSARLAHVRRDMGRAPRLRVGLVQANVDQSVKNQARHYGDFIVGRLWPLTVQADRAGAEFVSWPEAAWPWAVSPEVQSFDGEGPNLAALSQAHVLLGAATIRWQPTRGGGRAPQIENSAFLLAPDLQVMGRYVKHHLVPFGEYIPFGEWLPFLRQVVPSLGPGSPGGRLDPMSFTVGTGEGARRVSLGPLICFDAIFPEISRGFGRQDVDFLVNPTNDAWYGYSSGPYQFLAIVQMRAIETGKAVARPAYAGVTAVILPTGEVAPGFLEVGPVDPDLAPDPQESARLLVAELPLLRGRTLYTTFGDLFAWAAAGVAAALLGAALVRPRRPGRADPTWRPLPPTC